jgi:hypothetical protein
MGAVVLAIVGGADRAVVMLVIALSRTASRIEVAW